MTSLSRFSPIGQTVRSNSGSLTDEQIARYAPSVFAAAAHESRSKRYAYIPTSDVLTSLRTNGFLPVAVSQSRARDESKREHTKHMIRLRSADSLAWEARKDRAVGDSINEIVIINSHDGTSAYHMLSGVLRLVCTNGMVAGGLNTEFKIQHSGTVRDEVVEGAHKLLAGFGVVDESRAAMASTILTTGEQTAFARAALAVRYPESAETGSAPITAEQALTPRRYVDRSKDLWTTLNVVQENLVQGGVRVAGNQTRRQRTRAVTGIAGNVGLNQALWVLADELRKARA